jgi:DNA (cytosine-5)-methyltransferase 1
MTVGSLFAGIGGFDLAAREIGWTTVWYSEIDSYASAVMAKHFPDAVNLGDIRTITNPPAVDVLCGGFPCQDISDAGKRAGIDGERSGLWGQYARLIRVVRPRYVVVENVAALLGRGMGRVLGDLAACGYDAEWDCIPASAVGAPHRRDRLFVVAYADRDRQSARGLHLRQRQSREASRLAAGYGADVADPSSARQRPRQSGEGWQVRHEARWPQPERRGWWDVEPAVGRVAHGVPSRVDRLRCLGNAVVPQVAAVAFQVILDREASREAAA